MILEEILEFKKMNEKIESKGVRYLSNVFYLDNDVLLKLVGEIEGLVIIKNCKNCEETGTMFYDYSFTAIDSLFTCIVLENDVDELEEKLGEKKVNIVEGRVDGLDQ